METQATSELVKSTRLFFQDVLEGTSLFVRDCLREMTLRCHSGSKIHQVLKSVWFFAFKHVKLKCQDKYISYFFCNSCSAFPIKDFVKVSDHRTALWIATCSCVYDSCRTISSYLSMLAIVSSSQAISSIARRPVSTLTMQTKHFSIWFYNSLYKMVLLLYLYLFYITT